ncbi:MAG: HIT family protein [bacterium]
MLKKDGSPIIPPPAPEFEEPCLFCEMVAGRVFVHRVWEDDDHLAFLSSFPNTEGFTVVIPKEHYPSDVCELSYDARADLMEAAAHVAKMLNRAFADVGRTGIMFEGFGIDHVHAKLFPMHGSRQEVWAPIKSKVRTFFKKYEGFFSSNDGPPMSRERLARIAKKIIEANHKT